MDIVQLWRRVAFSLLPLTLLSFSSPASAVVYEFEDQGAAYAACQAGAASVSGWSVNGFVAQFENPGGSGVGHRCTFNEAARQYRCQAIKVHPQGGYGGHVACTSWNDGSDFYEYPEGNTCSTRPEQNGGWHVDQDPETSDDVCNEGCYMSHSFDITPGLPSPHVWTPSGATCGETETPPPNPDTDDDGTPDDDDAFPEDPEETEDTDGDGEGDNGDFAPEDEDNGADDGEGNESDNESSGGGTCAAAPSCSGDGIQCNQLFQLWQIRCTGAGGDDDGDDDFDSPPTEGDETAQEADTEVLSDKEIGPDLLDDSGWLSRSCPAIPTFSLGSLGTYTPDITGWCELIETIGGLIMLLAALIALRILVS